MRAKQPLEEAVIRARGRETPRTPGTHLSRPEGSPGLECVDLFTRSFGTQCVHGNGSWGLRPQANITVPSRDSSALHARRVAFVWWRSRREPNTASAVRLMNSTALSRSKSLIRHFAPEGPLCLASLQLCGFPRTETRRTWSSIATTNAFFDRINRIDWIPYPPRFDQKERDPVHPVHPV